MQEGVCEELTYFFSLFTTSDFIISSDGVRKIIEYQMKLSIAYIRHNYVQSYVTKSTIERKVSNEKINNQEGDLFLPKNFRLINITAFNLHNIKLDQ